MVLTPKGKLALALARLERSWDAVPASTQRRLIAAMDAIAEDYQPRAAEHVHVPLLGRIAG
jgi:hypothetical protein